MNDDTIQDLKQFIATTVSQQTSDLATKEDITNLEKDISSLEKNISKLDKKLSTKIDDLAASVGEALDTSNEAIDNQLEDHNKRISKLEQKAA
ncbi:MAG: hypothetical protein U5L95_02930 [Candidatus Saccharibacteria bacterium]|nr:hypothetical protein [Candidatus Saccharibacteria bacterium]